MTLLKVGNAAGATRKAILGRQRDWAQSEGVELGPNGWISASDWSAAREKQFVVPLTEESEVCYREGAGNELAGKMRAPHSSSVLAYNVLAPCNIDQTARDAAEEVFLGTHQGGLGAEVTFERKRRTGWKGTPPHLDAEIAWTSEHITAIESKFSETFSTKGNKGDSLASYVDGIESDHPRWSGMANLHAHARQIRHATTPLYELLDAPQLIKHALGLRAEYTTAHHALVLLWYDASALDEKATVACDQLRREFDAFRLAVGQDVDLRLVSHQELFAAYERHGVTAGWLARLRDRYF